jgi:hypothetical protein
MRQRVRPVWTPDELARIYAKPHDHTAFHDHKLRVAATIQIGKWLAPAMNSAADLSCGNGAILYGLNAFERVFGDYAPGWSLTGPIEETIDQIEPVDMFVCSETIEHLDDPDAVLAKIRAKTKVLLLSTPVDAWDDANLEHYWAWSRTDVEEMLAVAGFKSVVFSEVDFRPCGMVYSFGIWGCR